MSFPPPFHGANLSNQMVWESKIQDRFKCRLLDISDRRDLNNLGKFEWLNVLLGIKHLFQTAWAMIVFRPQVVYLLINQNKWAALRDCSIIWTAFIFGRAKVVIHLRGAFFLQFFDHTSGWVKKIITATLRKVDAAIVLGDGLKNNFDRWCSYIYAVPNGTDLLLDFNVEGKFAGVLQKPIVISFLSNYFKSKGFLDVLQIVKPVLESNPGRRIIFKMAGAWGLDRTAGMTAEEIKAEAERVMQQAGIEKQVEFLGVVTGQRKLDLLKETDIFLLPTSYDGHPRSIIEAMAAGCPVISTPVGAIPDTVLDSKTGFIIEPGDLNALKEKINYLIQNDENRVEMSRLSRSRYEKEFTKDRFIEKMIKAFESVLAQPTP